MKRLLRYLIVLVPCYAAILPFAAVAETTPKSSVPVTSSHTLVSPLSQTVNLNTADAQTIAAAHLKGLGKKRAEAIVAYRQQHGPFKALNELLNVKGISQTVIDTNRPKLLLN